MPQLEMPDRFTLEKLYLNGLLRNINSILAGVYGDRDANRARGERSDSVLMHILKYETLASVASRLVSLESRGRKQGGATLHDLAIAHVLLNCIQMATKESSGHRAASTLASSMLLGEIVPELRVAFEMLAEAFPGKLITELSDSELSDALGDQKTRIEEQIDASIRNEGRAKHLAALEDRLTPRNLLQIFSWIVDEGLDDRPFEAFLGVPTD
ncbi:MAG: hypothetical protein Aurels2KO_49890 [Aureliella sp.]